MNNSFPFFKTGFSTALFSVGLLFCQTLSAAVGFIVTPSTVSNTYSGNVTLQVTGLTGSETVVVQKYLDANTNGVIDGADLLWQQFQLTDGQASVIGGITNINVPGDTDGTPGQITAKIRSEDFVESIIGRYAYKLSSPTGLFAPITNSFAITNAAFAQSLTGNVVNNGTNVPNALVILFAAPKPGDDGPGWAAAATIANNSGSYGIKAPPGTYLPMAFKSNYVAHMATSIPVNLVSGATVTTNLTLINATTSISGRIADAANNSIGLPGLFLHSSGSGGLIAAPYNTDTNGNFTIRVVPGHWDIGEDGVETLGYISLDSDHISIDTTTGSVSGLTISYPKTTALFYGNVRDTQNQPIGGVFVYSNDNNDLYDQGVFTDSTGYYVNGALGGGAWSVDLDSDQPTATNYVFSGGLYGTNLSVGQALLHNFTAILATNHITGHLQDTDGNPLTSVRVYTYATIGGKDYGTDTKTDAAGNYSLKVANGNWSVGVCCGCDGWSPSYCCPNNQNVNISNINAVVNFTVPGLITTSSPLPESYVGDSYSFQFDASPCAQNLTWSATNPPSGLDLSSGGNLSGVPGTAGSNYFFVEVSDSFGFSSAKAFSLVIYPATTDVWEYYVNKLRSYRQTNAVNVVLDTSQGPYNAYLGIVQESPGLVSNATCALPTSIVKVFPPGDSAIELQVHDAFASESAFDAAYPAGNYSFAIHATNDGVQFPALNLPTPTYPNAPRISNFAGAQAINPGGDFLLQWDAFSGASADDFIRLIITTNGAPVFSIMNSGTVLEYWLGSTATSVEIPAGTLRGGRPYVGTLQFIRVTDVNILGYLGAYGESFISAQTVFSLATVSTAATLGQPAKPSATQFRFLLTGIPGQNYTIQRSTNLSSTNWSVLFVTNAPATSFFVVDPSATNSRAFYRALFGP